jgi:hypothetical protein
MFRNSESVDLPNLIYTNICTNKIYSCARMILEQPTSSVVLVSRGRQCYSRNIQNQYRQFSVGHRSWQHLRFLPLGSCHVGRAFLLRIRRYDIEDTLHPATRPEPAPRRMGHGVHFQERPLDGIHRATKHRRRCGTHLCE